MPKSETSNPNDGPSFKAQRYRPNWLAAVISFLLGSFLTVALVDYDPAQATLRSTAAATATNLMGWVGADTVWVLYFSVGVSTWLLPVFLFWMLYVAMRNARHLVITRMIAMIVAMIALASIAAMATDAKWSNDYFPNGPGGLSGHRIYHGLLENAIGLIGSGLILSTAYVFALMFIFTKDIGLELEKYLAVFQAWWAERRARRAASQEQGRKDKELAARVKAPVAVPAVTSTPSQIGPSGKKVFVPKGPEELAKLTPVELAPAMVTKSTKSETTSTKAAKATEPAAEAKTAVPARKLELNIVKPEETKKAKSATLPMHGDEKDYIFPPLSLLKEQVKPSASNSEEEHRQNAENLLRILSEFGVEVSLGEIHVGPVITRYEVVPAAGVRVEKIAGLDKNIALGMRAQSVRILAPIPGKAAVGVEVPNQNPTPVGLREILESEDWSNAKAELPIALGKDVSGKPLISDLTKMPHLLIAGATGSGKSVCINSIVASILFSASPKNVRLIMVDPKVVELKIFNSLPHMLIPVVTEPKKVPGALKWLLSEMEQRYQVFAKVNVRNIIGFNSRKKADDAKAATEAQAALTGVDPAVADEIEIPDRLPYIVAIIDELADLMMIAPAEIETSIARLAQLARAAGIHLIIATQRPSVNVITGVIKANLPSRIAFQVASQVDSRTILDTKGADTLIGRGDMLFSPPGTSRLVRAQGAFVADDEVTALVEFLKKNGPPQYAQAVQQQIDRAAREDDEEDGAESGDDGEMGDDEELYVQALDVLKSTKRASTSMLQRRLRIGYNRAARIMDLMEQKGVVGPENGSSPREILMDLDAL
ncbi:MAG: cell division FtsK/SpoIIIE [Verrucomicrobia bacterium]|nr:cell division FtsK/SpoIIIE [Verrucomicrobiota bacterium]